ncbi:MAG: AAA family ATPase, partial [Acidimicrobiia bacterium]
MFLEREGELRQLRDVLSELAVSGGKVVLVRGEAGIGKSTLIREFLDAVGGAAHLHLGFCDDLQTPQPYGPLWDMGRSEPELRRSLEARDRQRVLEGFFAMLALTLRPNVVVIEDIQWSDEATLDAVKYVGRRIARANGLLVLTYRDGEVDDYHPLRRVIGDLAPGTVVRVELGGLSYESVSSIVGSSDLDPQRVFEETRGNPFLATEMALAGTDGVPASVRDSVRARLGKLSRSAQHAVKILSVIPRRVSLADVTAFTGASLRELAEGERVGLLEVGDEMVSFRHDLIRRAIEASLTISESVGIHRALLEVIPAEADPALLVYHASQGADITRLLALGPEAAEAAKAVGSNREAAAHFRALSPHLGRLALDRRAQVLRDWALVELYLENAAAMEILDRAIELQRDFGTDQSLAAVLVLGVDVNRTFGRFATAKENAAEAVAILDRYEPSAELASALAAHAWLLIHLGHIGLAEAHADRALAIAEATGAESAQIDALEARGILLYVRGQPGGLD